MVTIKTVITSNNDNDINSKNNNDNNSDYINKWNKVNNDKYGLLTKLARSRWLDIGEVLFLRVYGPRRNKGFIIWKNNTKT